MILLRRRIGSPTVVFVLTTLGIVACDSATDVPPSVVSYTIQLSTNSVALVTPPGEPQSIVITAAVLTSSGGVVTPAAVQWWTDLPAVATVTQSGVVTAVSEGQTYLRARFQLAEASAVVTVAAPSTFTVTGSMTTTRVGHTATLLPDGKVLIAGGFAGAELYDPATRTFKSTGNMTSARSAHSATLLPNGKVLIAGGGGNDGNPIITAELYDPATGTFSRTGDMRQAQYYHEGTLLKSGKVLISGGLYRANNCCAVAVRPELYDPATGEFSTTGTYADVDLARDMIGLVATKATLLHDGRVFLTTEPETQLYEPVGGTFRRAGTMITGGGVPQYIAGQTATLLNDGRVLLTGGEHEDIGRFNSAEIYDPANGTFVRTGDMAVVRDGHTATLLGDGRVLISGGESVKGCAVLSLASAEIYDPSKGTFAPAGAMKTRREFHTATQLKDGSILVAGGLTFDGGLCGGSAAARPLASAELYVPER